MALLAAGCSSGDDAASEPPAALEGRTGLTPTYAPTTSADDRSSTTVAVTSTTETGLPATPTTSTPSTEASASITDPAGDVTAGAEEAPAWADLVGAVLTLRPSFYELRVRLGTTAPTTSGSSDHTLNVATFVDVDGDGQVDYELWANLADGGWDGSWFDDRTGAAAFSDDAAMDVLVEAGDLVVRFPPAYVGSADAFRWSLASEYGRYAALGTTRTSRDDAPDEDAAVAFPR